MQMKPTHLPDINKNIKSSHFRSISSGLNLHCPNGSVPIRRTTREDLLREQTFGHRHTYYPNAGIDPNFRVRRT